MRFNNQTKFGRQGNCFAACVSSLMDLPIDEVPNIETLFGIATEEEPPLWGIVLDAFITSKGFTWREATPTDLFNPEQLMLVIGKSLDGSCNHAVVYKGTELYHDPNPFTKGLSKIISYQIIEKV